MEKHGTGNRKNGTGNEENQYRKWTKNCTGNGKKMVPEMENNGTGNGKKQSGYGQKMIKNGKNINGLVPDCIEKEIIEKKYYSKQQLFHFPCD